MQYSESVRNKVIERALSGEEKQEALAEEFGVGRSTIQNWLRSHRRRGGKPLGTKEQSPQSWTCAQRLDALLETHGLSEEDRGAWCRERGVHTHQLEQWRRELIEGTKDGASGGAQTRALRQENRALKKELRRKDKALAETAALLVLKKKAAAIWGESEDE